MQIEAETLGFERTFPEIGPANVRGIEVNPYAAELARVSVWIGEIQWMRRNGSAEARNPIWSSSSGPVPGASGARPSATTTWAGRLCCR